MENERLPIDSPERREVARLAACQVEAIARVLKRAAREEDLPDLAITLAARLDQLAGVVMSAVDDEVASAAYLNRVLYV